MTEHLSVARSDGVATIEIDAPPLNLLTMELRSQLCRAALEIAADDEVRAVVLGSARPGVREPSSG